MYSIIVNPASGGGRPLSVLPEVEIVLGSRGLDFFTNVSQTPDQSRALALEAVRAGCKGVVLLGGDGTLGRVAGALMNTGVPMYFVPCGTGNDFIRIFKLPPDPVKALIKQLDSPQHLIDVCQMNEHFFLNVAGTGFDIQVLRQTERFKDRFSGLTPYLLGVILGIRHFRPIQARVTIDGQPLDEAFTIISIANGQYIGGGMRVAPRSDPADGSLDVMLIRPVSRSVLCLLFPLFIPGWHSALPITRRVQARRVDIEASPLTINLDGELIDVKQAHFLLHPRSLLIACPER